MVAYSLESLNIMGEFIQHIDSNDWLEWDYYTTVDKALKTSNADAVLYGSTKCCG